MPDGIDKDPPPAEKSTEEHKVWKPDKYVKALMDNAFSHSILLDREARILHCSDSLLDILGITDGSTLYGIPMSDANRLFHSKGLAENMSHRLSRIMSGENDFSEDDTIVWPSGNKRMYRITYKRIPAGREYPENIIILFHDITDLRLEEAGRHLNDLLYSSVLPCMIWDDKGNIVAYNDEFARVFGISRDLSFKKLNDRFFSTQPDDTCGITLSESLKQKIIHDSLEQGFAQVKVQLSKNDGAPIYFMVNITRISWSFSYRLAVYFYDMTDTVIKEAEAEEAEKRVRLMLDCNPLICILRDDKGNIIDCNQEALNLLGISSKAELCKNFYTYFQEFQPDGTRTIDKTEEIMQILDTKGIINLEREFKTPTGEIIPVDSKIVRIPWKDTYYYLSFSRDLRETKANERRMLEISERERKAEIQKEAARAASEAKSQSLANMSHEIRTPMNAVLGMAELLLQENLNKRQRRYAETIKTSTIALLEIINDILDVSKLQAGKLSLMPVHYNFNLLIDNVSSIAHFLVAEKNIAFELVLQGQIPVCLYGDDVRLKQVFLNLLSNASKFTEKGQIQLIVCFTDDTIKITVSDTGRGIAEEYIPKLFDAFEQADVSKNRGIRGTGLGLTITKSIVEMMKGQITLESVYGQGTSFHVEIPKILGDERLMQHIEDKTTPIYTSDVKILAVDDNRINLDVTCGFLQLCRITVETATSGKQAIELVQRNKYDIVFMDQKMPEMDGIETTAAIRKLGITVPIIALTASALIGTKELMLNSGMDDYLSKPIIKSELMHMLRKWIPDEKLSTQPEGKTISDKSYDEYQKMFWEKIEQIEELSVSLALNRIEGQRDVYKKTLRLMTEEIKRQQKCLNRFLSDENMQGFCIDVHSLKSSLAHIGAMELSEKARDLELASEQGNVAFCALNLPPLLEKLTVLNLKLKEAFSLITQRNGSIKVLSELSSIFERMMNAFDKMDLVLIDEEMNNLNTLNLSSTLKEEIEHITDKIMVMDYDGATKIMRKLLRKA